MSTSLILTNILIVFLNILALGVLGLFFADVYRRKSGWGGFVLIIVIILMLSISNTATLKANIDEVVNRINATKCKPSAVQKAPYRKYKANLIL